MLERYFQRIGYVGDRRPDLNVLTTVLQRHLYTIPFENLDVQFGKPVTTDIDAAYEKMVVNGRGGWCYEQNGLFGWALAEIGFDVTRVAAAVMRQERGDIAEGNHLCLLVRSPESDISYLADVGFGGGMLEPIPLHEGQYDQTPYRIGLAKITDTVWRFWEDDGSGLFSFDFSTENADESVLSDKCDFLQNDPSSSFVLNLVAQLRSPNEHISLRGRVLKIASAAGAETSILQSPDELVAVLREQFGIDVPEAEQLWPAITERHRVLFPD